MAGPGARPQPKAASRLRLDKWLWQARFFKTRALAAEMVGAGRCRVNGQRTVKPGQGISPGDVLTFRQVRVMRVVRVIAVGDRRGAADEARRLYDDLAPEPCADVPEPCADVTDSPLE